MKYGIGVLAVLGIGALAYWRYKKITPEEKRKINDKIDKAKENLSKFGSELKSKAENAKEKAEHVLDSLKYEAENMKENPESKSEMKKI
mgnify:CR=1 FL=1